MNFDFACRYEKEKGDCDRRIRCRDMPELLSWPDEGETFEQWARYAVEDFIVFRMQDGELIPEASAARPGEYVVRLSAVKTAKILLHNIMVRQRVTPEELASRMGRTPGYVKRLLEFRRASKLDTIEAAMGVLGARLCLSTEPLL